MQFFVGVLFSASSKMRRDSHLLILHQLYITALTFFAFFRFFFLLEFVGFGSVSVTSHAIAHRLHRHHLIPFSSVTLWLIFLD
ncbi:hypothetical protein RJT34_03986 [Clitoria ternatea]|uniref:Uncharacterized protein n=1 Tax=Clitoria ternatea TaxID=43366 RepID=A0AAN9KN73_CLITE